MPKISVLIPAYNVELYLRECIDSVLNQTMQDFEIICIDDASTDGTRNILEDYQKKDSRIKVFCHEKNKGQSSGRNDALAHATGDYVYMLDADDRIVPEAFEELYEICSRDNLDVVGFETRNFSDDPSYEKNVRIKTITYRDTEVMNGRAALVYCMENESFSLSTPTFMMKREYLNDKNIRFVEGILHEDVGYILELIVRANAVRFIHKVYFERRIRSNSTMTKGFTEKNIAGYLKSFYKSFELETALKKYLDSDGRFKEAFGKWQRDIFGRLNQIMQMVAGTDRPIPEGFSSKKASDNSRTSDNIRTSGDERKTLDAVSGNETGEKPAADKDDSTASMLEGIVGEEIKRLLETVKLMHWRTEKLSISECYLCGTGQYTERAIEALGAQDIIIRGIIVLEKNATAFKGFPLITVEEADKSIPVVISVSKYMKKEYSDAVKANGNRIIEILL